MLRGAGGIGASGLCSHRAAWLSLQHISAAASLPSGYGSTDALRFYKAPSGGQDHRLCRALLYGSVAPVLGFAVFFINWVCCTCAGVCTGEVDRANKDALGRVLVAVSSASKPNFLESHKISLTSSDDTSLRQTGHDQSALGPTESCVGRSSSLLTCGCDKRHGTPAPLRHPTLRQG